MSKLNPAKARETVDDLIRESTVDGKLDLKALRGALAAQSDALMKSDPDYKYYNRDGTASELKGQYMDELNTAVREVLGVIPKEQWRGKTDEEAARDYQPNHRLKISAGPKTHNPDKSLAEQGYSFTKKSSKELNQEVIQELALKVKDEVAAATETTLGFGGGVDAGEKKDIEKAMRALINEQDKDGVALNAKSKAAVQDVLRTLKSAGVTQNDKTLGDEMRELSDLAPAASKGAIVSSDKGRGR